MRPSRCRLVVCSLALFVAGFCAHATVRERTDPLIAARRMGTLTVRTRPGAHVRVTQLRHEFQFGTALNARALTDDAIAEAARENPQARYTAVLDCGDEPGLALGAMRHGIKAVRISNGPEISDKLADIATQRGVTVYQGEDPEIDLGGMTDPAGACRAWLRGDVS